MSENTGPDAISIASEPSKGESIPMSKESFAAYLSGNPQFPFSVNSGAISATISKVDYKLTTGDVYLTFHDLTITVVSPDEAGSYLYITAGGTENSSLWRSPLPREPQILPSILLSAYNANNGLLFEVGATISIGCNEQRAFSVSVNVTKDKSIFNIISVLGVNVDVPKLYNC